MQPVEFKSRSSDERLTVISEYQYHLNTFSLHGSLHPVPWQGLVVACELMFVTGAPDESGRPSRYAGPIVAYQDSENKYWIRPNFEFYEQFEKVEA